MFYFCGKFEETVLDFLCLHRNISCVYYNISQFFFGTQKPAETRMGSGKGSPEYWVAVVKPGRVMFELGGVNEATAREALRLAANKLPIKCKFVTKETEANL